ncbi:metalloregulator ArsR/SmtB family transcription factor [Wenzhouxiangella sp. XN24]|uniref:ArsR/SmtB family transcription factor n=1 Tax=Wenzhouxiangella sp. XN24 TaxID=2713569 RepID=UPI001F0D179D|nr:metalloregulator ArsR/SmtB family transcription factor [Wenzhouxiangella sp. XN24]
MSTRPHDLQPNSGKLLSFDPEEMRAHADEATRLLKALSNSSRLMVLCSLAKGELTVGQINERVPLSQSALSQHLAVLRRDGLVHTRRSAQTIYYSIADGPAGRLIETLHDIFCGNNAD